MVMRAHGHRNIDVLRLARKGTTTEDALRTGNDTMNLLRISDSAERGTMLTQAMEQQGLRGDIRRIQPSRSAVALARRSGRYRRTAPHDFILFDFSDPNEQSLAIVRDERCFFVTFGIDSCS